MKACSVPIDAGLRIEARYFTKLMMDPAARNMIRSLFLSMQDLGKGARRPANVPPTSVKKLGVLGAGMMGAGIAYVSALAGMEVVLIDRTTKTRRRARPIRRSCSTGRSRRAARRKRRSEAAVADQADDRLRRL